MNPDWLVGWLPGLAVDLVTLGTSDRTTPRHASPKLGKWQKSLVGHSDVGNLLILRQIQK